MISVERVMRLGWAWDEVDSRAGNKVRELLAVSQSRGVVPRSEISDAPPRAEDFSRYKVCMQGDLVLNRFNAYRGAFGVAPLDGMVSPDYLVVRPATGHDGRYLDFLLRSDYASSEMTKYMGGIGGNDPDTSGFSRIDVKALNRMRVPMRNFAEQRAIARFLDRETARIDTLIDEQQRLVEMLRERRWAVVEGSVARLDWTTPFRSVAVLIQTGPFGSQLKADEYEDGGIPVINPSHLAGGFIAADPRIAVSPPTALKLARHAFEVGDLVVARRGELGRCAVVDESAEGFLCGTGSALVRLDLTRMFPRFAATVFGSRRNRDALALASVGSTMDNLNSDIIGALRIPVPPLEEQRQIVASLERHIAKVDDLVVETERFVELSRERRAALITAAVTGQIDVRDEVA